MLQQTTVGAVAARYGTFLERFPDVATLARARESSVLAAWSGLGYYARARHLHEAARRIVTRHGAHIPRDSEALAALPGFGEYISAAVASLAFGARVPAVDANVARVVSRLFALGGDAGERAHTATVKNAAASLLPRKRPGDLTAALMDLGQQICTPRRPDCAACPLESLCAAHAAGMPENYPRRRSKPRPRRVHYAAAVARRGVRTLLVQEDGALLRGLWLFPSAHARTAAAAKARLSRALPGMGLRLTAGAPVARAVHTMVNRRLEISVYGAARVPGGKNPKRGTRESSRARWLTSRQLERAPIPTLTRKIAAAAGCLPPPASVTMRAF